ncbi:MAG: 16S rRNA (adenine(1518)-N(6)/adenine(1519)-N(6))-dimethyltransferase RsmA [Patescibacteria group bacterium]|nr:16S rRNA (adenine(1518)-N(6)/adenine(1519)-N(6))-dimethyltransferase RsmA [Patescibacteria group bacterium]
MLSQDQIKKILKEKDIKVLKSLGQNFLVDEKVLDKIIQTAELSKNDLVIEIGPGLGVLTRELSKKCGQVIAIEKDKKLAELLKKKLGEVEKTVPFSDKRETGRVEIVNGDVLKMNLEELIKKYRSDGKYKLVSNIPYYITSPVIKLFLENKIQPETIILLVQKEVAERICAKPGKLSVLALSVQIYGKPEIVGYVSKSSFYPEPKIDSAILKIGEIKKEFPDSYYREIFRIIKIGFSSKRKKLANNLSAGSHLDKNKTEKILWEAKINLNARAQELELEDWKKLV